MTSSNISNSKKSQIISFYESGATVKECSEKFNESYYKTYDFLRNNVTLRTKTGEGNRYRHFRERQKFHTRVLDFYNQGLTMKEISNRIGKSYSFVKHCFKDLEINGAKNRFEELSKSYRKERDSFADQVTNLFESGESILHISKTINRSREFVKTILKERGYETPTISDSMNKRYKTLSADQRRKITDKAIKSTIGKKYSDKARKQASIKNQKTGCYIGIGETEVLNFIRDADFEAIPQMAWNGYNIDIMVGNLAVEVHNAAVNPFYMTRNIVKTIKLISSGKNVVFIWIRSKNKIITLDALNYVVKLIKFTRDNPSSLGQYWVVRGDGKIVPNPERYIDDLSLILPDYNLLQTVNRN